MTQKQDNYLKIKNPNMKRILLFITFLTVCLTSYAQTQSIISGVCTNMKDGDTVYLAAMGRNGIVPVDSCLLKNGKFTLKDKTDAAALRAIIVIENAAPAAGTEVIVEKGVNLTVNFKDGKPEIVNSKTNAVWSELGTFEDLQSRKIEGLWAVIADSTKSLDMKLKAKLLMDSITAATYEQYVKVIYDNIPSNISGLLLGMHYSKLPKDGLNKIMDQMSKKSPNDPYYQALKQKMMTDEEVAVGKQYKEIALINVAGNMQRLSTVVKANKLVLVDFWASWCRPCIAEMPNVKKVYAAYHNKGLEIYGVSLDENQVNWNTAIQRLGMNWIHVSDLKGWQSKAAQTYNIQSIPATVLIDSSGKIIAKNLRGEELEKKIAEILK